VVIYPLINLRRLKLGVRELVTVLETSICQLLADYQIQAYPKADAPGVYVQRHGVEHKIASLGLRVRKGCSLHGLALNVAMNLAPFGCINPCGYEGLAMTQLIDCTPDDTEVNVDRVGRQLCDCLVRNLGYNSAQVLYRDLERPDHS
jgi:lipoyl(octanoyl) transferase